METVEIHGARSMVWCSNIVKQWVKTLQMVRCKVEKLKIES